MFTPSTHPCPIPPPGTIPGLWGQQASETYVGIKIVKPLAINLLTSTDSTYCQFSSQLFPIRGRRIGQ
ncbi:hypothetical protein E2C01_049020 [Portunus trituberculatus]|uniref:Uncharacterized protein n=1 Tax=Portunus trituberculatus TaxID=210409 RepID=A0A5B7GCP6_PORTR|nr:hypothetical protein [Portunus trituberculatus]